MTSRPTRATVAGRAYLDLQNLARRQGRPTDELHQMYALEGFLARLAISSYAGQLILKGGVLLAAYEARRPTRDAGLQARRLPDQATETLSTARHIAGLPSMTACPSTPATRPPTPSGTPRPTAVCASPSPPSSPPPG